MSSDNPLFPPGSRVICDHDPQTCTLCQWDRQRDSSTPACAYEHSIGDVGTVLAKPNHRPLQLTSILPEDRTVLVQFDGREKLSYMGPRELSILTDEPAIEPDDLEGLTVYRPWERPLPAIVHGRPELSIRGRERELHRRWRESQDLVSA